MRRLCLLLLAFPIVLSAISMTYAKNLRLEPSVSITEEYNDNIFLDRSDRDDDFITTVSPSISLVYEPSRYLDAALDYGLYYRFYSDHSRLNDTSLRETQRADLEVQARPFSRFFIDVTDRYRRVPVDVRDKIAPDNVNENMTDSNVLRVSPYFEIPLTSTVSSRFGYRYVNKWYKVESANDAEGNGSFLSLSKKFPFGLNVSLNYDYLAYRPDITNDYDMHNGSLGLDYQAGPDLRFWGGIGRTYIDYDDMDDRRLDTWNAGAEYVINRLGGITIGGTYRKSVSEADSVDVSERTIEETRGIEEALRGHESSVETGLTESERVDTYVGMGEIIQIEVSPYYIKEEELNTDRIDRITGTDASIEKQLSNRWTVSFDGLWERQKFDGLWEGQKFEPEDYKVRRYSISPSADYKASRYITTSFGYRYTDYDSERVGEDFYNNIAWIQAKVKF